MWKRGVRELSTLTRRLTSRCELLIMAITDDRDFNYDNEIELVQFIASEMQKERLDINNEENPDSYLNTQFM